MRVLNSLWVGDQLGILEQLCIRSALAAGHPFHLYSYEPSKLRGVPDGVEVRDAAEVMPRERMIAYAECNSYALGANFWRYELLGLGLGYWVDLDVLMLRPFDSNRITCSGPSRKERSILPSCSRPRIRPWYGI